jgi:EAL domain-containing protein (putative c-di-GMP-specific phosphodiesterase class I)
MRLTVEGVETAKQVDFLYAADADQVQGFYFGRPVPADEVSYDILQEFRKRMPEEAPHPAKKSTAA